MVCSSVFRFQFRNSPKIIVASVQYAYCLVSTNCTLF